jgi:RHH-type proline utilization regulon transcriptional repressor/proline dehydrogenase/delta 1-pyrroline-5-carboxylate dehydrogenase
MANRRSRPAAYAIVFDSAALLERAVRDMRASAIQSAVQCCSASQILYRQSDVEVAILKMMLFAMDELRLGDPWNLAADIGPVID